MRQIELLEALNHGFVWVGLWWLLAEQKEVHRGCVAESTKIPICRMGSLKMYVFPGQSECRSGTVGKSLRDRLAAT